MFSHGAASTALLAAILLVGCTTEDPARRAKPMYGYSAAGDPIEDPDATATPDAAPDTSLVDAGDGSGSTDAADVAEAGGGQDVTPDAATPDDVTTPTDTGEKPTGGIGSSCKLEADCDLEASICLDWPNGYCSKLDCLPGGDGCPDGSECHTVDDGVSVCLVPCEKASDCRIGYDCKRLINQDGTFSQACMATEKGAAGPAGICKFPVDCDGQATCLSFLPGGYCAVVGCGEGVPCPQDTKCVPLGQINACLRDCDGAHPCPGSAAKLQTCQAQLDIQGESVQVCMTGESGKDLGEFCSGDLDCLSKHCTIHATGRCSPGDVPCFDDGDCFETGGACVQKADYVLGTCSQACDTEVACPEGTTCVPSSATQGDCQVVCKGLSDVFTCDDQLGQACLIGNPLGGEPEVDIYACVVPGKGQVGALCDTAPGGAACAGGLSCLQGSGSEGYCTDSCGAKDYCPWSTVCGSTGIFETCLRRCKSKVDCPSGFDCQLKSVVTGVPYKVCFPL
jgi:hypothetical protein